MNLSLILLVIGFAVVVFLIFKFIKKLVFAVITLVAVVVLIIGAVFTLAYLDYNYLTSQTDYTIKVLYEKEASFGLGLSIPVVDSKPNVEEAKSMSKTELLEIEPKKVGKDDSTFVVVVNDVLFQTLLEKNEIYEIPVDSLEGAQDLEISFSQSEVENIISSEDPNALVTQIIIDKNNLEGLEKVLAEPIIASYLGDFEKNTGLSLNEAAFALVLQKSFEDEEVALDLVEAFKGEDLKIYPDRFTFKLVRYIVPVETIKSFIPQE